MNLGNLVGYQFLNPARSEPQALSLCPVLFFLLLCFLRTFFAQINLAGVSGWFSNLTSQKYAKREF